MTLSIFAAVRRNITSLWADRPLRIKGLIVVAVPLTALLVVTASFYFFLRTDREADTRLDQAVEVDNLTQSCLSELLEREGALNEYAFTGSKVRLVRLGDAENKFQSRYDSLEKLFRNDPELSRRLDRIRQLFQERNAIWAAMDHPGGIGYRRPVDPPESFGPYQAALDALLLELHALRAEQEVWRAKLAARVNGLRARQSTAIAANALLGLGGGLLAILYFTTGVSRGLQSARQDAQRLAQRLPMLPRQGGRDELGRLQEALETASLSLRRSEEERGRFFTLSVDMLAVVDLDGHFKRVNPAFTPILGHSEAELLAKGILDFIHPDDRQAAALLMLELASGSSITCQESRFCCADGYYKWVAWSSAPFPAEGLAYAVLRDIDKRKLDEQALRQSNARLANVLDSMTDAFFSVDREWRLIYVNPEAERLLMHQRADLLGRNFWEVFPEAVDGPFYRLYDQVMRTGTPGHLEESSPHPPLNRWFEVHAYPIEEGLSVYFRDATERRASEERITRALQEKEVLLREVHHRVKNNLQVIYSMLRLQAGYVHDEQLLRVLGDCRERVRAMALLHDQLHRAKDLSSINLAEYIKSLAASLFCSYGVQSSKIGLRMNLEEIAVAIDTAIPCGLIVNELVSNSLRHAFPGSATGHVSLGLRAQRGGQVELTVGDDGRGFSHNADTADGPSLGLRLVSLLAAQVEAEVVRSNSAGTHYRFVFKPLKSKESE